MSLRTPPKLQEVTASDVLAAYYRSGAVRERLAEYCGGHRGAPESFATFSIAGFGGHTGRHEPEGAPVAGANAAWIDLLADGADICRSLADRGGTLLQLDIDYTDPDEPLSPYLDAETCFRRLEPVYQAARETFVGYGLRPLALMTGRGWHLTLRAPLGSPLHAALVAIGAPGASLRARYERHPAGARAALLLGYAHEGAGRLLELLAHRVAHRAARIGVLPVTLADVPVPGGGPFACLDLSAYADPLFSRHVRCAFSGHQKAAAWGVSAQPVICLPRDRRDLHSLLAIRASPQRAIRLAARVETRIPEAEQAPAWLDDYAGSRLRVFHEEFDQGPQMERGEWPYTYDVIDPAELPACAASALMEPNPLLLRPGHLRTVALAFWAMGWHPRSVAGLVRSKYERDYGWGSLWRRYDPAARAEFYVRLFCGAVVGGIESGEDFTCEAQALRGVCRALECGRRSRALFEDLGLALDDQVRRMR